MRIRLVAAAMSAALLVAGCVSTTPTEDRAQPKQAARFNVRLGVAYMQQGRLDLALHKLQRALRQDPNLPSANTAIARLYERRGNTDLATRYYQRALDIAPHDPKVQNAYGVFLCRHDRVAESEAHFLAAARDPDYTTAEAAYTNAGICLLKINEKDKAEADFRRALQVEPDYAEALWQLARLSYDEGKYLQTRAFLQRFMAHAREPQAGVLWLAARTEKALGADAEAQKFARRLMARFPRSAEATLASKMMRDGR
ncbi:MAG TPA: type IV pilus biogenesis/stability protein PilW [Gammaproteobacteria bacterium]|jgi:type IV pilus assembly protein PilF|nr:type IV pilus biogenesis/stability protein PilW [Gammaproteobacteria bacterium]